MFLAWGLLAPAGVLVARFTKHVQPAAGSSAFWFTTHRIVQIISTVLSVVGLVLAIVMVAPGPHFSEAHHIIGVVVVALGLLQPTNACCRPAKAPIGKPQSSARTAWERLHKGTGYAAILLAVVAVVLGLQRYAVHAGFYIGYGCVVAVLLTVAVWRQLRTPGELARRQRAKSIFLGTSASDSGSHMHLELGSPRSPSSGVHRVSQAPTPSRHASQAGRARTPSDARAPSVHVHMQNPAMSSRIVAMLSSSPAPGLMYAAARVGQATPGPRPSARRTRSSSAAGSRRAS